MYIFLMLETSTARPKTQCLGRAVDVVLRPGRTARPKTQCLGRVALPVLRAVLAPPFAIQFCHSFPRFDCKRNFIKIIIYEGSSLLKRSAMVKVKVKVKVTLEQITKAQRGSRGIALLFL
jgi:hypothetical protein